MQALPHYQSLRGRAEDQLALYLIHCAIEARPAIPEYTGTMTRHSMETYLGINSNILIIGGALQIAMPSTGREDYHVSNTDIDLGPVILGVMRATAN